MNPTLLVGILSAATALTVFAGGYSLNRRRDRDLEWRKLKLEHYKDYLAALSGITGRRSTAEAQARYADAFNSLALVAPASVLKALYLFNDQTRISNSTRTPERYNQLLNTLVRELRRDIHPELGELALSVFLIDAPAPPERLLGSTDSPTSGTEDRRAAVGPTHS